MDKLSKYEKIIPFQDIEYTVAIHNGKAGLISKEGEPLTEFIYDNLEDYYKNEFLDVFDDLGVENVEHWKLTAFENKKYCSLRLNGKWGLLNNKGEVVLDFKYNSQLKVVERDDLPYHYLNTNVLLNENWEEFIDKNKYDHIAYNATLNNKILYIGKADIRKNGAALNERIEELIKYGYGKVPNHKGGKAIWQIQNNEQLLVCWETLDEINRKWNKTFDTAKSAERTLIDYFYNKYNEYPLANMEERGKYKKHL